MQPRLLSLGLAAITLGATNAHAAPKSLPGVTLDPPAGFSTSAVKDGVIFRREVKGAGGAIIAVESRPLAGAFDAAFEAAAGAIPALKEEEPFIDNGGETTLGHKMRYEVRCCGNGRVSTSQTTVAFNPPGRIVTASLIEIGLSDDEEDSVEAAFEALVAGLDFAGFGKRPPMPRPLGYGTALDGFYTHTEGEIRINPFGGTDFVAVNTTYAFEPSGRFAATPPLAGVDVAQRCAADPEDCGVYTVIGTRIALKTVDGRFGRVSVETLPFAAGPDGALTLGKRVFTPVQPERSLTLDGTWTYVFAQSGSTALGSNSVSTTRTLTFTRDGRYTRTGSSSFATASEVGDSTVRTAGGRPRVALRGTYAIDGFTLTLTPAAAGAVERLSFYRPDKEGDLLMIDGDSYLREGRD